MWNGERFSFLVGLCFERRVALINSSLFELLTVSFTPPALQNYTSYAHRPRALLLFHLSSLLKTGFLNGFLDIKTVFWSFRNLQVGLFLISTFASNSNFNIHTPGRRWADVFKTRWSGWRFSVWNLTAIIRDSTLSEIRFSFRGSTISSAFQRRKWLIPSNFNAKSNGNVVLWI